MYAIDPVHFLEGDLSSHLWGDREKRLNISLKNQKNRLTYSGALDLLNPDLIVGSYPRGNGDLTVEFVRELILINQDKQVLIFRDGASYHPGQIIRDFLQEVNEKLSEEDWKVTSHLFAPDRKKIRLKPFGCP